MSIPETSDPIPASTDSRIRDHDERIRELEKFRETATPTLRLVKERLHDVTNAEAKAKESERRFIQLRSDTHSENLAFLNQARILMETSNEAAAEKAVAPLKPALATVQEIREAQIEARGAAKEKELVAKEKERLAKEASAKEAAERERTRVWREWLRPIVIQLVITIGALSAAYIATTNGGHQ